MRPNSKFLLAIAFVVLLNVPAVFPVAAQDSPESGVEVDPETLEIRQKLRRISIAVMLHDETLKSLPPVRLLDGNPDAPQLSWRVHLLPFLGEAGLYEAFHFDEPWDSPHNKRLLPLMPSVFQIHAGREKPAGERAHSDGRTRFQAFAGEKHLLSPQRADRLDQIPDGASETILAVVTGSDKAVPWTAPDTLALPNETPFAAFGTVSGGRVEGVLADGQFVSLTADVKPETLIELASAEGNPLDADELKSLIVKRNSGKPGPDESAHHPALVQKLRQLGLAMHNFHDTFRQFPQTSDAKNYDDSGRPLLSWRVHLLPFLDQKPLYDRFLLDEPWDSEHNKKLLEYIPEVLRSPTDDEDSVNSRFVLVTGDRALFSPGGTSRASRARIADVRDGSSSTLMIVQAGQNRAVPWTAPQDANFDRFDPLKCLGTPPESGWPITLMNAEVRIMTRDIAPRNFSALVTPAGGEVVRPSELRKQLVTASPFRLIPGSPATAIAASLNELRTKLKRLGLALHSYHQVYRNFPLAKNPKYFDEKGKPKLSWRVHILPFLEQEPLYRRFNLYESWDSPQNKPLLELMPDVFRSPDDKDDATTTRFQTLTGPLGTFNVLNGGPRLRDMRDGTSNTLLVVQVGADKAVPWTKPADAEVDPEKPLACLGKLSGPAFVTVMADGAVRTWQTSITATLFRALATPQGGEVLKSSDLREAQVK